MSLFYKTNVNFCRQILIGTWDVVKLRWMGRDKKGNCKSIHRQIAITLEKRPWEKNSAIGKNYKQEENKSSPPPPNSPSWMVSVGYCSLDWLRESGWRCQLNNNLTWRNAVRKIRAEGEIKNKRKTHRNRLPHATSGTGMVVACPCFLDRLREGGGTAN